MTADVLMPRWLTDEHAITLATWALVLVTFLLAVATFVLWFDSWKKGKEQRERWAREDEQHKQDREEERARWKRDDEIRKAARVPAIESGLHFGEGDVFVWASNLGTTPFVITEIHIEQVAIHPESVLVGGNVQRYVISINETATPGETRKASCRSVFFAHRKLPKLNYFDEYFGWNVTFLLNIKGVDGYLAAYALSRKFGFLT